MERRPPSLASFPGSLQELWRGWPRSLVLHQKISGNRRGRWACVRTEVKSWFRCCSPSVSVYGSGFRGEFLWEWDIAERQLLQLANAFSAIDYEWRTQTPVASAKYWCTWPVVRS